MNPIETKMLKNTPADIALAAELLKRGELVVMPTETVYGLAADARNEQAVAAIFTAKGRPQDNPLIVHISALSELQALVRSVPEAAKKLAAAYWPGPLTMILPRADSIPAVVSAGLDTVAVRFPSHPVAQALIRESGCPLAAPSANVSGSPSPTTAAHVAADLTGRVSAIVDGGACQVGLESTVVSLVGDKPRLLRPGGITLAQLQAVLGDVEVDDAVTHKLKEGAVVASPGMKYKHYAPKAKVVLVKGTPAAFAAFVNGKKADGVYALCFSGEETALTVPTLTYGKREDASAQAQQLFYCLRRTDELGAKTLYTACPSEDGVGLAVYNRLLRAAAFEVIDLDEPPQKPVVLGLTGPTGSGKSAVADVLKSHGAVIIDADKVAREVVEKGEPCLTALVEEFGADILNADGTLDRRALAAKAFASDEQTARLTALTHPFILARMREELAEAEAAGAALIVVDAPLLFESKFDSVCDNTVAVLAPREARLARICARDGISEKAAAARMARQPDDDFYAARATRLIRNDGDLAALHSAAEEIVQWLDP